MAAITRTSTGRGRLPPHREHLALLEQAQELGLEGGAGFADLVEEERAAMGEFEMSGPVGDRTFKLAFGTTSGYERYVKSL